MYRKTVSNPITGQANPLIYTPIEETDISKSTNKFTTNTTYDNAGQVTTDIKFRSTSFAYDANGRQIKATRANVPDAWTVYDASGNRVATKINDVWQYMVYDAFGKLVAEYGIQSESLGGIKYVQQDWQGSVRTVTNSNGFVVARTDHQAFGGDVGYDIGQRSIKQGYSADKITKQGYGMTERDDETNETTWQMGRYALGFGFRFRGEQINQNSTANFGGTYTFSGRAAPVLDANNTPVTNGNGSIQTTQINSLESYRRTLLFRQAGFSNQRIRELGGGANQFTISGGNPALKATQYDVGFYVQNSYKISETIAASFGVRYENQTNISSDSNFAPRFGIIWAPKAKEKQNPLYTLPRVSVGYGMFFSRFALNNTLLVRQASDAGRAQYLITDTNILDIYPTVPTVNLLQQFALPQTQRFIDDAFETPYQSLLNITAAKKMPKGYNLNFTFSGGRTVRQSFTQNINAPLAGTFNPLTPSLAIRPFGNVGNIYESRAVGKNETDRYSANLNFPQSPRLFGSIRYSFTKSKNSVASGSGSSFDPYDFSQEFAVGPYDGVHNVSGYFWYTLTARKISIGSDFSVSSGSRFNIFTGRDMNGDGYFSERPSFTVDLSKPNLISTIYGVLDPNPSPTDKLIPRNLGRGPNNIVFNSSISKVFGFGEDKKNKKPPKHTINLSLRVSNVFNIINKGNPVGNMSSPNFLRSLSGFSDGGISFINGAQQVFFPGRSISASVGFGF